MVGDVQCGSEDVCVGGLGGLVGVCMLVCDGCKMVDFVVDGIILVVVDGCLDVLLDIDI